mgnify:CR=1 FL=1
MTDMTKAEPGPSHRRARLARSYVRWLRRRNPDASPAEIVALLEKQYLSSVTAAGAVVSAGSLAAGVAVAMMPLPGSSKAASAGARTGKNAARAALRRASKVVAFRGVRSGVERAAMMLPAGDQQLQFELTTLFGLALADIHGLELDKEQSDVVVYGLTNRSLSQSQIAQLAAELLRPVPSTGRPRRARCAASGKPRRGASPTRPCSTPSSDPTRSSGGISDASNQAAQTRRHRSRLPLTTHKRVARLLLTGTL